MSLRSRTWRCLRIDTV